MLFYPSAAASAYRSLRPVQHSLNIDIIYNDSESLFLQSTFVTSQLSLPSLHTLLRSADIPASMDWTAPER